MNQQFYKNMALWVVILLMVLLLVTMLRQSQTAPSELPWSDFLAKVDSGEVESVTIEENHISGRLKGAGEFATYAPAVTESLLSELKDKQVHVAARPARESPIWQTILIYWFPFLLFIGLWVFFIRQMQAGGGKAMSFGKARARLLTENQQRITFDDVAGVEEAKQELEEIIEFLRSPRSSPGSAGASRRACCSSGPPGTGKTLLARAVAGEAGVPFFSISGSDFVEMFVGVGASRVRDLFEPGQEERALHHLHRRDRRRRASPRRGPRRRPRRARADAEPAPRRDGRLRVERGRDPDRGHQPPRRARPGAAPPGSLRPPRGRAAARPARPRSTILKVHTRRVPLAEDVNLDSDRARDPGLRGRRPRRTS